METATIGIGKGTQRVRRGHGSTRCKGENETARLCFVAIELAFYATHEAILAPSATLDQKVPGSKPGGAIAKSSNSQH